MEEQLYIQHYYYHLLIFLLLSIIISVFSYTKYRNQRVISDLITIIFGLFTVYYLGSRSVDIGVDTYNYKYAFEVYESLNKFEIRKDPFYDFISYVFSKTLNFQSLLTFCAFLYVFGALYCFRKIFNENYYLPFIIFLISPYFFQFGINVMRNGVAASLFLVGLGTYYSGGKKWKVIFWIILSLLFHLSMFVPILAFLLSRFFKKTSLFFYLWLLAIILGILKINVFINVFNSIEYLYTRFSFYTINEGSVSSWSNFIIFGAFPVFFAVYNIVYLKYKDEFYIWLTKAYMIIHIPYIILINSQFALRLGYLSEFMMPLLLLFPLLINSKIKIRFNRIKLCSLMFLLFLIKAYKILII